MLKKILALILTLALLIPFAACGDDTDNGDTNDTTNNGGNSGDNNGDDTAPVYVKMVVRDFGTIILELYPDMAPITVENFVTLAESGFYDGLTFHRIIEDFMIQGGDPKANGTGNSGKTIYGEFYENNYFKNTLSHKRGTISMARGNSNNSASCQFFICNADATYLDGNYAAFGTVIEGMDVVDAITSGTLPYTPYYEYYGTPDYEMLKAYGYLSGAISDKSKQAVIESVRVISYAK